MRKIKKISSVRGTINVPADKSISHRLFIFSAISSEASELLIDKIGEDVKSTISVLVELGTSIESEGNVYRVLPHRFSSPIKPIYMGNSGTTTRLLTGLLAAYRPHIDVVFYGDSSLSRRPMRRVIEPLQRVGAKIFARDDNYLPMFVKGDALRPIDYTLPIPSAQVKSALILAALFGESASYIKEPILSRDHTERFLSYMGINIYRDDDVIIVNPGVPRGIKYKIPGDFSQAAFFITLALLVKDSKLLIGNVNLNPTRIGFLNKVLEMGADIDVNIKEKKPEPVGELVIRGGKRLKGITIDKEDVPLMIDELPLFAVLSLVSEEKITIRGAEELRVKESDRIRVVVEEFSKLGIKIEELPDGFLVYPSSVKGGVKVSSHGDHRVAMALSILGMMADEPVLVEGDEAVSISYPDFFDDIEAITL